MDFPDVFVVFQAIDGTGPDDAPVFQHLWP